MLPASFVTVHITLSLRLGEQKTQNPARTMKTNALSLLVISMFISFASLPPVQGVSPAPDGGYPGGNTAEGQAALLSLTSGTYNTAIGIYSLLSLTDGDFCTGVGAGTLLANTGDNNTATGAGALLSNTEGSFNTANGAFALFGNTTGRANTATGDEALVQNTTGENNTATGAAALNDNIDGNDNTADGFGALASNTSGGDNIAVGRFALSSNTTGNSNIALGSFAGLNLTTGDANIDIGNPGVAGESATIRIGGATQGKTFIAGIRGVATGNNNAVNVVIDSAGQLGTISSSRRFKKEIRPMDKASEAILGLKPVTFHYNSDERNRPEFGLIAEDVAEVNPDLVVRDKNGEIYTVRYEAVNAMLLNEFLKEHRKVEQMEKQIEALASGLEKVSAQLEASQLTKQVALKNRNRK
jgi:Chaperone of endosialidase